CLFQRSSYTDFDTGASRHVCMWRRHSPVITPAWSFLCSRKRAAYHHGIRTTRQRFANVAAPAHPAVGDNRHVTGSLFEVSIASRGTINCGRNLWHPETEHAARSTRRPRADADQDGCGPTFHNLEGHVIPDSISDDHRDAHLTTKFFQIERFVFGGNMSRRRDGALDNKNVCSRFLGDFAEFRGSLRDRADSRYCPAVFDLTHACGN